MCGIATIVNFEKGIDEFFTIKAMTDSIRHRGPDDQGFACFSFKNNLAEGTLRNDLLSKLDGVVGFDRLSIIDTSKSGHQPMMDSSKNIILAFNGEIYNANDLKKDLTDFSFRGHSDTEVILNLYIKYGFDNTIKMLNGMFAILIIDIRMQKIYMARDRVGIKPLYWTFKNRELMICSEIKGFLFNKTFKRELNLIAAQECFMFGDNLNRNMLLNVEELNAGEIVEIDGFGDLKKRKFFDINNQSFIIENKTEKEYLQIAKSIIFGAVKRQMISDVKLGCQLSGGVDSSLITYYANSIGNFLNDTVSIIVPNNNLENFSEEKYIDEVCFSLKNLNAHKFVLEPDFIISNIERAVWHYEAIPTIHNIVALLKLSGEAKKFVTVLLSGEGADELFGGYYRFIESYYVSNYFNIKKFRAKCEPWEYLEKGIRGLAKAGSYAEWCVLAASDYMCDKEQNDLWIGGGGGSMQKIINERLNFFAQFQGSDFNKLRKYEFSLRLKNLLMRQDKTSMANSIENRVPLLDNSVVDLAFSLPENQLLGKRSLKEREQLVAKSILKKLCAAKYGETFTYRNKMGFALPIGDYLTNKQFVEMFNDSILPGIKQRGILNEKIIQKMWKEQTEFDILWRSCCFEIWCKKFIDFNIS